MLIQIMKFLYSIKERKKYSNLFTKINNDNQNIDMSSNYSSDDSGSIYISEESHDTINIDKVRKYKKTKNPFIIDEASDNTVVDNYDTDDNRSEGSLNNFIDTNYNNEASYENYIYHLKSMNKK